MARTIAVVGYGPGISRAVAERFGAENFTAALIARNAERLEEGVRDLALKGIEAGAFAADAGDPASIRAAFTGVRRRFGPLEALHWNAIGGMGLGDLMQAKPAAVRSAFDVAVIGLLAAVQAALPDLRAARGSVLITNGAFGELTPAMDAFAISAQATGLALANAAKAKLAGLLAERLRPEGVHVGEVMVAGTVNGTPSAPDGGGLDPAQIGEAFWRLFETRELRARVG